MNTLRTDEVSKQTGASLRQLQHWDETGMICPPHDSSGYRAYPPQMVRLVRIALALRRKGVPLREVRHSLSFLSMQEGNIVVSDGNSAEAHRSERSAIGAALHAEGAVTVVSIEEPTCSK